LLLYSSKPSLGVYQLAGHFTSSTQPIKFSGTIITAPSTNFLAPLPGKSGRLLRGEFSHAHRLLCYYFALLYLFYLHHFISKTPKN
jgi:hypothetical protein